MLTPQKNTAADAAIEGADAIENATRIQFEEPSLEKRGDLTEVTAGGFGAFSP